MTWLAIIGWAAVALAVFGAYVYVGIAMGEMAIADRRDQER